MQNVKYKYVLQKKYYAFFFCTWKGRWPKTSQFRNFLHILCRTSSITKHTKKKMLMCVVLCILKAMIVNSVTHELPWDTSNHILTFCCRNSINRISELSSNHYYLMFNNFNNANTLSYSHLLHLCSNETTVSHLKPHQTQSFNRFMVFLFLINYDCADKFTMKCLEITFYSKNSFIINYALTALRGYKYETLIQSAKYQMYNFTRLLIETHTFSINVLLRFALELIKNPLFGHTGLHVNLWKIILKKYVHNFHHSPHCCEFQSNSIQLLVLLKIAVFSQRIEIGEITLKTIIFLRSKRLDVVSYRRYRFCSVFLIQRQITELGHTALLFFHYLNTLQLEKAKMYLQYEGMVWDFFKTKDRHDKFEENLLHFYHCELKSMRLLHFSFIINQSQPSSNLVAESIFSVYIKEDGSNSIKEFVKQYFIATKNREFLQKLDRLCKKRFFTGDCCCSLM